MAMPLLDWWFRRYWRRDPRALARWEGLAPATVVTGGSEGIGLALARRFAKAGDRVVLVARRAEPLSEAAAAIEREFAVPAVALALDVRRADAAEVIRRELAARGLYVDVLVNNAGVGLAGLFEAQDRARIEALLELNVRALTQLMHTFLPDMCVRGRGGVLNIGSLGGFLPGPWQAVYYASKAYVSSLTEAVAWETRGQGVRVAVVAPGPVETRFHLRMGAQNALYRWLIPAASPDAVAAAAFRGFRWRRTVIIPGILGPFGAVATRLIPHPLLVPVIGWLLRRRGEGQDVRSANG
jgi:hypothetical protein